MEKEEKKLNGLQPDESVLLQIARIEHALLTHKRINSRDPQAAYLKVQKRIKKVQRRHWLNRVYAAAACFIGVLIVSTLLATWMQKRVGSSAPLVTVCANAGMRTHFSLPDGTLVHLNSGSTLSYPLSYDEKARQVKLSGEAYFKVTHNPAQPFIVSVANDRVRVKVLGTEFNLQAYENENNVQTTLVNGSVNVEMRKNDGELFTESLQPSEKAIYDLASHSISIRNVDVEGEIAWKDGRLVFKDLPLPQVLKELSLFYNVRFNVTDPVINSYCFTGTFNNRQLSQVLEYLKISCLIDYEIKQMKIDDSKSTQQEVVTLYKRRK